MVSWVLALVLAAACASKPFPKVSMSFSAVRQMNNQGFVADHVVYQTESANGNFVYQKLNQTWLDRDYSQIFGFVPGAWSEIACPLDGSPCSACSNYSLPGSKQYDIWPTQEQDAAKLQYLGDTTFEGQKVDEWKYQWGEGERRFVLYYFKPDTAILVKTAHTIASNFRNYSYSSFIPGQPTPAQLAMPSPCPPA